MSGRRQLTAPEVRAALRSGLEALAASLPAGTPAQIERLSLRLPAGAGATDIARALERAIRVEANSVTSAVASDAVARGGTPSQRGGNGGEGPQ